MATLSSLQEKYHNQVGRRDQIQNQISKTEQKIKQIKRQLLVAEKAKNIVRTVALETQEQLEFRISSTVSAAQQAVFDDPYDLYVKFIERRNKTECDLLFERNGEVFSPLASSGYGAVDIAAFALRVASWSMSRRTRSVLLLDEPFKHLKGIEENRRAIAMMQEIAKELHLQIITISDERAPREDIAEGSDKVFEVSMKKGKSQVKEI